MELELELRGAAAGNGSFQFQAALAKQPRQAPSAWTALGLQLKAEKVIYFVLRFLTTFSTLYNGNDSRILQHQQLATTNADATSTATAIIRPC